MLSRSHLGDLRLQARTMIDRSKHVGSWARFDIDQCNDLDELLTLCERVVAACDAVLGSHVELDPVLNAERN